MDRNAPDEKLLKQFAAGDRAALGELAERYERPLLGLASGLLNGSRALACDAVQEVWLRVIRFADRFDGRSSVKTWLYRITINQCHSLRASESAFGRAPSSACEPDPNPTGQLCATAVPAVPSTDGCPNSPCSQSSGPRGSGRPTCRPTNSDLDPHQAAESSESLQALRTALESLPDEQRDVLLLCYHHGLSHPDAAEILEIPLGTLKSRLHAALKVLRARLKPEVES
jgi:RNA polymerase sigma-70 factor, ECF subfamily